MNLSSVDEKDFGHCEMCRKGFFTDLEIYGLVFVIPKAGFNKFFSPNQKIKLCRECYGSLKDLVIEKVFKVVK